MNRLQAWQRRLHHALRGPRARAEAWWLVSEGGWKLHARVWRPPELAAPSPAVLVVPGLGAPGSALERWTEVLHPTDLTALGCIVVLLDLSGRGRSWGNEDYGGPGQQGDVRAALRAIAALPDADPDRIGILSLSLGAAAVAGALSQGDRPRVAAWLDWEGPSDREIITAGGRMMAPALGHTLEDETYWRPREAVRHVGRGGVYYLRYQSARDHAQPGELRHAERMIRAAAEGALPFFQLNDHEPGRVPAAPRWMPPGAAPARAWIVSRIREVLTGGRQLLLRD